MYTHLKLHIIQFWFVNGKISRYSSTYFGYVLKIKWVLASITWTSISTLLMCYTLEVAWIWVIWLRDTQWCCWNRPGLQRGEDIFAKVQQECELNNAQWWQCGVVLVTHLGLQECFRKNLCQFVVICQMNYIYKCILYFPKYKSTLF